MLVDKKQIKENIIIFLLCLLFISIGILITQNEIYSDEWFIVGSASGQFGKDNVSLMTLCSNYIITGLIYLFSQTGLRLNWLLIIELFFETIIFFLVFKSMIYKWGTKKGIIIACLFIIMIIPSLFRMHSFTIASSFIVSGGAFWLIDSIRNNRNIKQQILGVVLIIIGFSIREDVIYFSIYFFGIIWLMDLVPMIIQNRKEKQIIINNIYKYTIPFAIVFCLLFLLSLSQEKLMGAENPGFYEWNNIRCQVDNFPIPDFNQYEDDYKKIGISVADYNLLRSLNCYDPDYFTLEKYKEIINLKNRINHTRARATSWQQLIVKSAKGSFDCVIISIFVFFIILGALYKNKKLILKTLIIIIAEIFLIGYFIYIDRFIQRIEWSIWLNLFFIIFLLLRDIDYDTLKTANVNEKILISIIFFLLLFGIWIPSGGAAKWNDLAGKNLYKQYRYVLARPDNFGRYLYNNKRGYNYHYATNNNKVTEAISKDKSSFYYNLANRTWIQYYPLSSKNIFQTSKIGTCSNFGPIADYIVYLKPIRNNFSSYGIKNPFKDIIKNNIKILVRKIEVYYRTYEIYSYVKEHYYPNICFSLYEIIDDVAIGKYIVPIDTSKMNVKDEDIGILYGDSSINKFFSVKVIGDYCKYQEKYLQLEDSRGNIFIFTFEKDKNIVTFYKEILDLSESYKVKLILIKDSDSLIMNATREYKFNEKYKINRIDS